MAANSGRQRRNPVLLSKILGRSSWRRATGKQPCAFTCAERCGWGSVEIKPGNRPSTIARIFGYNNELEGSGRFY